MPVYRGSQAKILYNGAEVGRATEVTIEVDQGLTVYYAAGTRVPEKILEGPIDIHGSWSLALINKDYLQLLTGSGTLDVFQLSTTVPGAFSIYLYGCKFSKGSVKIPATGVLTEDYDFMATSISVS